MQAANRVALNTGILYTRMLLTVGVTLYSTRLVLNALGAEDYGIYNLVAGVIAMLSFLNAAMTTSTQRYLSFHQGKDDRDMQKKVFTNSIIIHIVMGLLIVAMLQLAGVFLFDGFLNIPAERVYSAKYVFLLMSVTVFFTVVSSPFTALLNAHENMLWIAIVNIIEVLIKLMIAILLLSADGDRLVLYSVLIAGVGILSFTLYAVFCFRKYDECTIHNRHYMDFTLMKELSSFAGWNLFGAACGVARTQGLAVILNLFFGTVVNAAYGIANQVSGQLNFFSATMLQALNPQIMKSEGAGDRQRMLRLSMMASKFGFFLMAFISIPCIFEMPSLLEFWLKKVPNYTVIFCQLALLVILVNQLTIGLQSAIQATGNIKRYITVVGSILLFNLPMAYALLRLGFDAHYVLITSVVVELVGCSFRVYYLKKFADMSVSVYFRKVFYKELIPVFVSVATSYLVVQQFDFAYRFLFTISAAVLTFVISVYFFGLEKEEKDMLNKVVDGIKSKIYKNKNNEMAPNRVG